MEGLIQPDRLRDRIMIWSEEEIRAGVLPARSGAVLEAVLYRGELPRGDVAHITSTSQRQARRVTAALIEREVLVSDGILARPVASRLPRRARLTLDAGSCFRTRRRRWPLALARLRGRVHQEIDVTRMEELVRELLQLPH